jgi:hypothetical protein
VFVGYGRRTSRFGHQTLRTVDGSLRLLDGRRGTVDVPRGSVDGRRGTATRSAVRSAGGGGRAADGAVRRADGSARSPQRPADCEAPPRARGVRGVHRRGTAYGRRAARYGNRTANQVTVPPAALPYRRPRCGTGERVAVPSGPLPYPGIGSTYRAGPLPYWGSGRRTARARYRTVGSGRRTARARYRTGERATIPPGALPGSWIGSTYRRSGSTYRRSPLPYRRPRNRTAAAATIPPRALRYRRARHRTVGARHPTVDPVAVPSDRFTVPSDRFTVPSDRVNAPRGQATVPSYERPYRRAGRRTAGARLLLHAGPTVATRASSYRPALGETRFAVSPLRAPRRDAPPPAGWHHRPVEDPRRAGEPEDRLPEHEQRGAQGGQVPERRRRDHHGVEDRAHHEVPLEHRRPARRRTGEPPQPGGSPSSRGSDAFRRAARWPVVAPRNPSSCRYRWHPYPAARRRSPWRPSSARRDGRPTAVPEVPRSGRAPPPRCCIQKRGAQDDPAVMEHAHDERNASAPYSRQPRRPAKRTQGTRTRTMTPNRASAGQEGAEAFARRALREA